MSQLLTASAVQHLVMTCALGTDEVAPIIEVSAIRSRFGFHRDRVLAQRPVIDALLAQLPIGFRATSYGGGGGWTFLNACYTEDERHWGEHRDVELLVALGLAIGSVEWLLPRDMWHVLPGSMPYFHILQPQLIASNG